MFLLPSDYLKVKKTKRKGKGVFANKDILPGTVIADYLGTFIRAEEEEEYEKKHGFYSMYYHDNASVFPDLTKDGAHLFNHSCAPNCYMYTYKGHTLYFALRKIFKGEELTVSYLLGPLDSDCTPCTHECLCNSDICTNSMHTNKERFDKWVAHDDMMAKKTKLRRITYGAQLEKLDVYPESISDNDIYVLFGSNQKPVLSLSDAKIPEKKKLRNAIRESGRRLYFEKLGITVSGVADDHIVCKATSNVS